MSDLSQVTRHAGRIPFSAIWGDGQRSRRMTAGFRPLRSVDGGAHGITAAVDGATGMHASPVLRRPGMSTSAIVGICIALFLLVAAAGYFVLTKILPEL